MFSGILFPSALWHQSQPWKKLNAIGKVQVERQEGLGLSHFRKDILAIYVIADVDIHLIGAGSNQV